MEKLIWKVTEMMDFNQILTRPAHYLLGLHKFHIKWLLLHVTDRCNLNCRYCYANEQRGKVIPHSRMLSLITEAKRLGVRDLLILGGEPFLYDKLRSLLNRAASVGLNVILFTNGSTLTDRWITYLKRYKNCRIVFKLDSPKGYEAHIGHDMTDIITERINKTIDQGFKTYTFITITAKNFDDHADLIRKSFDMGALPVIERFLPSCPKEVNELYELTPAQWKTVLDNFEILYADHRSRHRVFAKIEGFNCSCFTSTISIDSEGDALPCPYAPKEMSVGNVNSMRLAQIFKEYEKMIPTWHEVPEECRSCKDADICKGGCKTHVYYQHQRYDRKDKLCTGQPPTKNMNGYNT